MKYFLGICVVFFSFFLGVGANVRSDMNPLNGVGIQNAVLSQATGGESDNILEGLFGFARDFIFDILWIVAVGVFLYFGFKLVSAQGNPDEMKKVFTGFLYAVIGLAVIPLSWGLVKLVSSLDF